MSQDELQIIRRILQAIDQDWAVCDDGDDLDYMVLVNECREIMDDLKPGKLLIRKMEETGLIETNDQHGKREYIDLGSKRTPVPFVYMYIITKKGYALLRGNPLNP